MIDGNNETGELKKGKKFRMPIQSDVRVAGTILHRVGGLIKLVFLMESYQSVDDLCNVGLYLTLHKSSPGDSFQ